MADVADGGERGRSDLILSCALCDVRFLWDLRFESAFEFEFEYLPLPQHTKVECALCTTPHTALSSSSRGVGRLLGRPYV